MAAIKPDANAFTSWGRIVRAAHVIERPSFRDELSQRISRPSANGSLPVGLGRSYGDSCLNPDGRLIDMTGLDRLIEFDPLTGRVRAEAGLSLSHLLTRTVPAGWFTTTSPGTRFVTLGGAVANDVHGKNHHTAGSFGCGVTSLEIVRSDTSEVRHVFPGDEDGLFAATTGGLGLTGVIATVGLSLTRIESAYLDVERMAFGNVADFFACAQASETSHEHTVAWIDCASGGRNLGRGIYQQANWCSDGALTPHDDSRGPTVPMEFPNLALNSLSVRIFNEAYFRSQRRGAAKQRVHYAPFFYPLDKIRQWNRIYGNRGFYQYQCAVPPATAADAIPELLRLIAKSGAGSFLAVLKMLGSRRSPGLLSFAREGTTLALDFPNRGQETLDLLAKLDTVVSEARGWLYPAKDGRMPAKMFQASYPQWQAFSRHVDPALTSAFWRRVSAPAG